MGRKIIILTVSQILGSFIASRMVPVAQAPLPRRRTVRPEDAE